MLTIDQLKDAENKARDAWHACRIGSDGFPAWLAARDAYYAARNAVDAAMEAVMEAAQVAAVKADAGEDLDNLTLADAVKITDSNYGPTVSRSHGINLIRESRGVLTWSAAGDTWITLALATPGVTYPDP